MASSFFDTSTCASRQLSVDTEGITHRVQRWKLENRKISYLHRLV